MTNSALLYEQSGPVGWINLNRPNEMNAINLQMLDEFEEILPRIANDDAVKVIVLTGKGRAFCAGADLKEILNSARLQPGEADFIDRLTGRVLNVLRDFPKPVIAALNGIAKASILAFKPPCVRTSWLRLIAQESETRTPTTAYTLELAAQQFYQESFLLT